MTLTSGATTPVLAGFYPDPSICRVGDDYYLVTSSFELFPGVPIWHSRDLVSWTQIGNVLDRPSQLALEPMTTWIAGGPYRTDGLPARAGAGSDGVYAATIRHHGGRFWVTTTVANSAARGPLIVSAEDPAGPWTDPVHVAGLRGIDSDLAWDDDDVCHMSLSSYSSGSPVIVTAPIDPLTGEMLGPERELWPGTGRIAPEAPHLYRRDGWWYLLLAEGGTAAGHAITIARSRDLDGPWEPNPANPILARSGVGHAVQYAGHGDLVETPDGEWAMVYLGVRLRGFPGFHVNGRETFVAGVEWRDDWPHVREDAYQIPRVDHAVVEDFARPLGPHWVSLGGPTTRSLRPTDAGPILSAADQPWDSFIAVRARDEYWSAYADMDVARGEGCLLVRLSDDHYLQVRATAEGREIVAVSAGLTRRESFRRSAADGRVRLFLRAVPASGVLVHIGPDVLEVGEVIDGVERVDVRLDGRHLSTEVAGGFTGRLIGVRATQGEIVPIRFEYRPAGGA